MFEGVSRGIKCLFYNKMRVFLTILGIAVGVTSVVIVRSIGNIGTSAINTEMSGMGMDNIIISANYLSEDELGTIKEFNNVEDAMPLMSKVTSIEICGKNSSAMVWGVNEDADKVVDLEVKFGRLLNRGDVAQKSQVCIVDTAISDFGYSRENIVGKKITVNLNGNETELEVVGVVDSGVSSLQSMLGGFIPDFVYIPYSVMQNELGTEKFDNITVKLEDESDDKTQSSVSVIKNTLEHLDSENEVRIENLLSQKDTLNNIVNIASLALSVVAGISLIVSGISIMTVMLVSVSERTREIGIKKSIGATTGAIMSEFLFEAVLITVIGGVLGFVVGTAISSAVGYIIGIENAIDFQMGGAVLLISMTIGIVFGVYPAKKAARLQPVEALRQLS